jgi:hypothetical protein
VPGLLQHMAQIPIGQKSAVMTEGRGRSMENSCVTMAESHYRRRALKKTLARIVNAQ